MWLRRDQTSPSHTEPGTWLSTPGAHQFVPSQPKDAGFSALSASLCLSIQQLEAIVWTLCGCCSRFSWFSLLVVHCTLVSLVEYFLVLRVLFFMDCSELDYWKTFWVSLLRKPWFWWLVLINTPVRLFLIFCFWVLHLGLFSNHHKDDTNQISFGAFYF